MARRFPQTRRFAPVIGLLIIGVFVVLGTTTEIPRRLELKLLDAHFRLKSVFQGQSIQEGVTYLEQNPAVSPDIVILGIDTGSLNRFGRWPWPRWRHADLVNTFARILSQESRERALFLDLFFIEPADDAYGDAVLVEAIGGNGRVFLETVLANEFPPAEAEEEFFRRHEVLFEHLGRIAGVGPSSSTARIS